MRTFIDAGELGFSISLSAHLKWLRKRNSAVPFEDAVLTYPDRHGLFPGCLVLNHPPEFYIRFHGLEKECFAFRGANESDVFNFYKPYTQVVGLVHPIEIRRAVFTTHEAIYERYAETWGNIERSYILVMPRFRRAEFAWRNLPENYWAMLIKALCERHQSYTIVSVGTHNGAYSIDPIGFDNYSNLVGAGTTIDDLFNLCSGACAAIGSQSAPPKLTLLQGVPTFIIGHEDHTRENWSGTPLGRYPIEPRGYHTINVPDCLAATLAFVAEHVP